MQATHHYLELRKSYASVPQGQPVRISLEQMAEHLHCTVRNVKLIIRKMQEAEWIDWQPGRGRGNKSQLIFHFTLEEMLMKQVTDLAEKEQFQQAVQWIDSYTDSPVLKENLLNLVSRYFGYQPNRDGDEDILRLPIQKIYSTFDPAALLYAHDVHASRQIFDTLVRYDRTKHEFTPSLAHYWETDESSTLWTFYLRKGIFFHHGRELEAADVRFSLERLGDPSVFSPQRWILDSIEEIRVLHRRSFQIRLNQLNVLLLHCLSSPVAAVLPRELCEADETAFFDAPVGTGPFRIEIKQGQGYALRANERYFMGRPFLDKVELIFLQEATEFLILSDACNMAHRFAYRSRFQPLPNWNAVESLSSGCTLVAFNHRKSGPLQNVSVRKFLRSILDGESIVHELGESRAAPASRFLPDKSIARSRISDAQGLLQNTDVFADTGMLPPEGPALSFSVHCKDSKKYTEDTEWMVERCARNGIHLDVILHDRELFLTTPALEHADLMLFEFVLDESETLSLLEIFLQEEGSIRKLFSDSQRKQIDERVAWLMAEPDASKRHALFDDLEALLKEECMIIFLYHRKMQTMFHPSVRGLTLNTLGNIDYRNIWFEPEDILNDPKCGCEN
ncbi:ABC transporter substrate-binding protein [Paenibacillus lutrae]|uniref:ABC transporter substrate-binding protein n=1 Tax=Paenibacillus lutrae TaxID=2078573 RepID=A0A7X3FI99_9BACL|nr:ABC transporter substrate-binding protein [Paenibacillus lutrae]MVP00286.1 ABC transporter substrate-binding protein [Paenibacillus lutrae]